MRNASFSDITVLLVTYESSQTLSLFLERIDPKLREQILVVDNASRDQTILTAKKKGVRCMKMEKNTGFARAANVGARAARGRYLCFMNPDCRPTIEVFRLGLAAVVREARCCAVPLLDEGGGSMFSGRQPGYTWLKLIGDALETNYGKNYVFSRISRLPKYHDDRWCWPHGACFFISRDFFLELGGFNERYYLYMEDVDFGRRLSAAGGKILELACCIEHFGGGSSGTRTGRRMALLNLGRTRYAARNHGIGLAMAVGLIALPACLLRIVMGR